MQRWRQSGPRPPTLPGLDGLRGWRTTVRSDVLAGVALAAYLIPQCMAYARLAGLEPVRGLWAAIGALVLYALLGTSSLLSVGPESASALLVSSSVATIGAGAAATRRADIAVALAGAVAVISLLAWAARLGFVADLLSRPVLVGYMAGVAIAMIVGQLPSATGIPTPENTTVGVARHVVGHADLVHLAPLVVAAAVAVALAALHRFRRFPGPLVVVLGAAGATAVFHLQRHGVATSGRFSRGLPIPGLPGLPAHMWPAVFASAAGISVVVFSDNIITARSFAARTGDRIDPNQELLALAGANAAASAVGGFPVSSSGSRTAIVEAAGGRSQLAGLVAAGVVTLVLVVGGSVLESFPLAALAGLVIFAATRLVNVAEMGRVARFRRSELFILAVACTGVVLFGVLVGIAVAVGLSVAELFVRIARAHDAIQGTVPGLAGLHDVDDYPDARTEPGLVVYRYDGPLCFANADDFRTRVLEAVDKETTPVEWVLLNMEANVEVDLTAVDMLEELRATLAARHVVLALARVKRDLAVYLDRTGFTDKIGPHYIFATLPTALAGFRDRHGDLEG